VLGLSEGLVPRDHRIPDENVRLFLVALTRTRKECHLLRVKWYGKSHASHRLPPQLNQSPLLSWISEDRVTQIVADARYFQKAKG